MSGFKFQKATKKQSRARIALMGISGSGKTWGALEMARGLGTRIAVIDTERGSASKYSDHFQFDVLELDSFGPEKYIEAIKAAEAEGYDVVIIDSLSHAWAGKDGILGRVDRGGGMTGGAWKNATPLQNKMIDAILTCKAHVIVTMRAKTAYEFEKNEKGKIVPRKVGLAPIQRGDMEYEFDLFASLDADHNLSVEKTRCASLDGRTFNRQNPEIAATIKAWLTDGASVPAEPVQTTMSAIAETKETSGTAPALAIADSTPAPAPATVSGANVVKATFPGAVELNPEREEALHEIRAIISEKLNWEVAQARGKIALLFPGKKATKDLDDAQVIQFRDHLRELATAETS